MDGCFFVCGEKEQQKRKKRMKPRKNRRNELIKRGNIKKSDGFIM